MNGKIELLNIETERERVPTSCTVPSRTQRLEVEVDDIVSVGVWDNAEKTSLEFFALRVKSVDGTNFEGVVQTRPQDQKEPRVRYRSRLRGNIENILDIHFHRDRLCEYPEKMRHKVSVEEFDRLCLRTLVDEAPVVLGTPSFGVLLVYRNGKTINAVLTTPRIVHLWGDTKVPQSCLDAMQIAGNAVVGFGGALKSLKVNEVPVAILEMEFGFMTRPEKLLDAIEDILAKVNEAAALLLK